MLFTSYQFILFVLIALILYYVAPKRIQWIVLLCMNMLFYLYAGLSGIIFIVTTIITTYAGARLICREKDRSVRFIEEHKGDISRDEKKKLKNISLRKQKMFLTIVLFINFGILAVLKYTNMFIVTFTTFNTVDFVLPMGISFYTFQSTGYMIDVYRGVADAEKNPFRYALFVSFFPQLVQGPISRWNDLKKSLLESHAFSWINIQYGFERILWGYFKKMVIADRAAIGLATIQSDVSVYYGAYAFVGMLLYAIDLYADFTGGIDITIGVAQMFGITLPENFRRPFFSKSIAEYWRRWHITLGVWFKTYVFYPVSVSGIVKKWNKFGKKHCGKYLTKLGISALCLFPVWICNGLWHGARWSYIFYGMYYFVILLAEVAVEPLRDNILEICHLDKNALPYRILQTLKTWLIIFTGELFFRANGLQAGMSMFFSIFKGNNIQSFENIVARQEEIRGILMSVGLDRLDYFVVIAGCIVVAVVGIIKEKKLLGEEGIQKLWLPVRWTLYYALIFAVLIILFTYFYTAITINPTQMAEDMKRNNGFIPGIKPGKQTAEYIDVIMSRITLPGSFFLALVAIMPAFAGIFGVKAEFAQFFGGTSLLILVGVVLDTLQQVESHLLMRHYDGLLKSGRIKGRSGNVAAY